MKTDKLPVLILPVKKRWFDMIRAGTKMEDYRLMNEYWRKRLEGKEFSKVVVTLGYPPKGDTSKRMEFEWRGFRKTPIIHPEWNDVPKMVYAIAIGPELNPTPQHGDEE